MKNKDTNPNPKTSITEIIECCQSTTSGISKISISIRAKTVPKMGVSFELLLEH
ncbi:MAG: hypothetical protein OEQ94_08440 [Nitrosopumilus sp.]|nr:hypothetical protein [Nitrosopumilus sp.]MDH3823494.1 hypothetical protein [Nitrosopumilus sp.]